MARDWWPIMDVYSPLPTVEHCIKHHRREKEFRAQNEGLHIVPSWEKRSSSYPDYINVILVIDSECRDWKNVLEKAPSSCSLTSTLRGCDQE
jgi:hypothetical protein